MQEKMVCIYRTTWPWVHSWIMSEGCALRVVLFTFLRLHMDKVKWKLHSASIEYYTLEKSQNWQHCGAKVDTDYISVEWFRAMMSSMHAITCWYVPICEIHIYIKYKKRTPQVHVLDLYLRICGDQVSNDHVCMWEHIAVKKCKAGHLEYQFPSAA